MHSAKVTANIYVLTTCCSISVLKKSVCCTPKQYLAIGSFPDSTDNTPSAKIPSAFSKSTRLNC